MGVAVCIGAGDLGSRVATRLVEAGHDVHVVRRRDAPLPAPLVVHRADITDRASLDAIAWPAASVLTICVTAGSADEAAYRAVYVDGVRNVLASLHARECLPSRVVFVSTTAVYGMTDGGVADESSPTGPRRFNGTVMLDAEANVRATSANGVTPVCARLGGIYGAGRARLLERVRSGDEPVIAGARDPFTNRIHVDDAARAVAFLADHPAPPPVVNVVDDEPVRRSEVVRWLAERLGVPVPEVGNSPTSGRDDDKRVANALLRSLGFTLTYPTFREGYAALLGRG
jgi:nucleoside-diphosphate-sugar epimerase